MDCKKLNVKTGEITYLVEDIQAPTSASLAEAFRAQRDMYIKKLEDLLRQYEREDNQKNRGVKENTKHTKEEYEAIADLIEAMCNIPTDEDFPNTINWPAVPAFLLQYM